MGAKSIKQKQRKMSIFVKPIFTTVKYFLFCLVLHFFNLFIEKH